LLNFENVFNFLYIDSAFTNLFFFFYFFFYFFFIFFVNLKKKKFI
jgi:hypothetical protein